MLDHSTTFESIDTQSTIPTYFSHEKKSSDLQLLIGEHIELIDSLMALTGHGFLIDDFGFILERLSSQAASIHSCLPQTPDDSLSS